MRDVLRSMALDHRILKQNYPMMAAFYALGALVSVLLKVPFAGVALVMILTAPFVGTYFSLYAKNHLDRLYGSLPLDRTAVVVGRYLYNLVVVLVNAAVASLVSFVISRFVANTMTTFDTSLFVSFSFLYFCLFLAVLLPLYFKVPFSKVYVVANLPFYLVFVGGMLIVKKTDFLKNIQPTLQYFSDYPAMIWVTGIGVGLALLAVSLPLSVAFHRSREAS